MTTVKFTAAHFPQPTNLNGTSLTPTWQSAVQVTPATPQGNLGQAFKPNKAGKKKSHIIFILDDSYSMQSCRDATIEGFNEYLESQKATAETDGIKTFASLYKFDGTNVNCVYSRKRIEKVEELNHDTYNPRGSTNLHDAVGGVMMQINELLTEKKNDSIIINILTDGHENTSRTFNSADVKLMVSKAEEANWAFTFMGANIDAFAAGSGLGFQAHNTIQFDTHNVGATMRAASRKSADLKTAYASGMDTTLAYASTEFTASERAQAMGVESDD